MSCELDRHWLTDCAMLLVLLPQHLVSTQLPHAPTGFEIEEVKDKGNRRSFAVG